MAVLPWTQLPIDIFRESALKNHVVTVVDVKSRQRVICGQVKARGNFSV